MAVSPLQHATRSEVFEALFSLLQTNLIPPLGASKWKSVSQTPKSWDDVPPANQPALILCRGPQSFEQKHAYAVNKLHWRLYIVIYFRTDGQHTQNTYPDQITDPIMDSLEQFFTPNPPNQAFTLGGLVENCWLDGMAVCDPGVVDGQGFLMCPVSILI